VLASLCHVTSLGLYMVSLGFNVHNVTRRGGYSRNPCGMDLKLSRQRRSCFAVPEPRLPLPPAVPSCIPSPSLPGINFTIPVGKLTRPFPPVSSLWLAVCHLACLFSGGYCILLILWKSHRASVDGLLVSLEKRAVGRGRVTRAPWEGPGAPLHGGRPGQVGSVTGQKEGAGKKFLV
jgi:hypothetical protein